MQEGQDLHQMSLKALLNIQDLVLEEILDVPNILTKIKLDMSTFVQHCIAHPEFTQRFINIGLKCPMHQSNNPQMKNFTHIAAEVLTSDHQQLAELFILSSSTTKTSEGDQEIEEQIQTEEPPPQLSPAQKYIFLHSLFDYLCSQELDQNCVNYIAKAIATLIRKKLSQLLEFFTDSPQCLQRLIDIAHYPSVAHLVAKMLTDDDDSLTDKAFSIKQRIIPMLLNALHSKLNQKDTIQILQGVEDILNATRYSDDEEPTALQTMSDELVSQKQVKFFLSALMEALQSQYKTAQLFMVLRNSTAYLSLLLARIGMDEQHEYGEPQEYHQTLSYQLDEFFLHFCKIITILHRVWEYRNIVGPSFGNTPISVIQPLSLMTRHSQFLKFYKMIERGERCQALQALLRLLCTVKLSGVLLQATSTLFERMLTLEEKVAATEAQIVDPDELNCTISQHVGAVGSRISGLLQESIIQNNKNQKGIFFRKILLVLQNYYNNEDVLKRYPQASKVEKLFPAFNAHDSHLYAKKTIVLEHPGGNKAQPVEQFAFIKKNVVLMKGASPTREATQQADKEESTQQSQKLEVLEVEEEKVKKMTLVLNSKIQSRKDRVKLNKLQPELSSHPTEPLGRPSTPYPPQGGFGGQQQEINKFKPITSIGETPVMQAQGSNGAAVLRQAPRDLLIQKP